MTILYHKTLAHPMWHSLRATEIGLPDGVHIVCHRSDGSPFSIRTMQASELLNLYTADLLPQVLVALRKFASECFIFVIGTPKPAQAQAFAFACYHAYQLGLVVLPVPDLETVPALLEDILACPETAPNGPQHEPPTCVDQTYLRAFGMPHDAASSLLEYTGGRLALGLAALTDPDVALPAPLHSHRQAVRALLGLKQDECLAVDVLANRKEYSHAAN